MTTPIEEASTVAMAPRPDRRQVLKVLFPPLPSLNDDDDALPVALQFDTESLRHTWDFVLRNKTDLGEDDDDEEVCVVCLEALRGVEVNQDVVVGACSHKYHYDCIMGWMMLKDDYNKEHSDCPTCRQPLFDPEAYRSVEAATLLQQKEDSENGSNIAYDGTDSTVSSSSSSSSASSTNDVHPRMHVDEAFAVRHAYLPNGQAAFVANDHRVGSVIGTLFATPNILYCLYVGFIMVPVWAGRHGNLLNFFVLAPFGVAFIVAILVACVVLSMKNPVPTHQCLWRLYILALASLGWGPPLASLLLMLLVNGTL